MRLFESVRLSAKVIKHDCEEKCETFAGNGLPPCDVAAKRTEFSPLKINFLRENQTSGKEKPAMIA